jgi:hypothetical protein
MLKMIVQVGRGYEGLWPSHLLYDDQLLLYQTPQIPVSQVGIILHARASILKLPLPEGVG